MFIDEYDKPLFEILDNKELNEQTRKVLKSFYGVLKAADVYIRFVFLTGVTKFSNVSVFSDFGIGWSQATRNIDNWKIKA